jgi:alpha/beta superfamily hydrolase
MPAPAERLFIEPAGPQEVRLEAVLHQPESAATAGVVVCHPHPQYGGDMDNYVVGALCEQFTALGLAALRFNFRGTRGSEGSYEGGSGEVVDLESALRWLRSREGISRVAASGYSFGALIANRARQVAAIACVSPASPLVETECPLFVAIGERDQFMNRDELQTFAEGKANVTLEVFEGADHFWGVGLGEASAKVSAFLHEHLVRA